MKEDEQLSRYLVVLQLNGMKRALRCFLLSLLIASPAMAQPEWFEFRDALLGRKRSDLMIFCSMGRDYNSIGESYWSSRLANRSKADVIRSSGSEATASAFMSGLAAAMNIACPDVRQSINWPVALIKPTEFASIDIWCIRYTDCKNKEQIQALPADLARWLEAIEAQLNQVHIALAHAILYEPEPPKLSST